MRSSFACKNLFWFSCSTITPPSTKYKRPCHGLHGQTPSHELPLPLSYLLARLFMTSNTSLIISGSRAEVGSSNNNALGFIASPCNRYTLLLSTGKLIRISICFIIQANFYQQFLCRLFCSLRLIPRTFIGASTKFSRTVICGNRLNAGIPSRLLYVFH